MVCIAILVSSDYLSTVGLDSPDVTLLVTYSGGSISMCAHCQAECCDHREQDAFFEFVQFDHLSCCFVCLFCWSYFGCTARQDRIQSKAHATR